MKALGGVSSKVLLGEEKETPLHLVTECFTVASQNNVCFGRETCRMVEAVPATGSNHIFEAGKKEVENVVETAPSEGTMDLKLLVKCSPFSTINVSYRVSTFETSKFQGKITQII